jgi:hypothetical protein
MTQGIVDRERSLPQNKYCFVNGMEWIFSGISGAVIFTKQL